MGNTSGSSDTRGGALVSWERPALPGPRYSGRIARSIVAPEQFACRCLFDSVAYATGQGSRRYELIPQIELWAGTVFKCGGFRAYGDFKYARAKVEGGDYSLLVPLWDDSGEDILEFLRISKLPFQC